MITVYFDTSFFVNLARAEGTDAAKAIGRLRALDIRHVVARPHLLELLRYAPNVDADAALVVRAHLMNAAPLVVDGLQLGLLLESADERERVRAELANLDTAMTRADATAATARRNAFTVDELRSMNPELVQACAPDRGITAETALALLHTALESCGLGHIEIEGRAPEVVVADIHRELRERFGDAPVTLALAENALADVVVGGEPRTKLVALGQASPEVASKLANSIRDGRHMATFLCHSKEIDFFQMDRPQFNKLLRTKSHPLRAPELADRCFTAPNLDSAVAEVERLVRRSS